MSFALDVPAAALGRTEPRLWTPSLRPLTPDTSYGFDVIDFARETLRRPLDPWQEWAVIHAGELLPDGRPRFRIVLLLVARQNGKTELLVVLTLFWQFVEARPLILGTSTKLDYAKESWRKATKLAEKTAELDALRPMPRWKREANGEQESWTIEDARYKIAASNEEGGRSLTIDRLVTDELRQHHDYSAWEAAEPACSPWDAQIFGLSNAGDDRSAVLNDLRAAAIKFIETGEGDPRLGLLEWSAPEGADPLDIHALAQANPNLGNTGHAAPDPATLLAKARRAVENGGEALAKFKTENMCQWVPRLRPPDLAVDGEAWKAGHDPSAPAATRRTAAVLDVSKDQQHAALVGAAVLVDGRVRVKVIKVWTGVGCADRAWSELPAEIARTRPAALGWFPAGPGAAGAAAMAKRPGWPPAGTKVDEIKSEVPAVCMGFAELVAAGKIVHADDQLLNDQVTGVEWSNKGEARVFVRAGHANVAYAAAGAVHLARTLPPPPRKGRLIVAD